MLSIKERERILEIASSLIHTPRTKTFKCADFVRLVYRNAVDRSPPPLSHNLTYNDLEQNRRDGSFVGYVIYLKRKSKKSNRAWSHIVILFDKENVIHNSYYFGRCVTLTPIDEILSIYDVVLS